ncbi:MAG: phycobilisome protein [Aphanocapsa lilacina HA4352-LM1]|jgi:hypothetical protein|nr:phycobilisome protein [Aphanocapsa lilacina HA4352-LM1]
MQSPLSDQIKTLIAKAKIMGFDDWQGAYPTEALALLRTADAESRHLTDADLNRLAVLLPEAAPSLAPVRFLRDHAKPIVSAARSQVLEEFPGITEPGGDLYPAVRAEACWRDYWHFLRSITYGIAARRPNFTSREGVHYLHLLYQELRVPLAAMLLGIHCLKGASLQHFSLAEQQALGPYFDHLAERVGDPPLPKGG